MLYQTKTSKKNNLKFNRLKLILHKVKFIAKNVIYIKNFSSEIKKSNNTLANSLPIILNYPSLKNTLFSDDEFEINIVAGNHELAKDAQRLRYKSFFNETQDDQLIDVDEYDVLSDHLVVVDKSKLKNNVVGTYRLLSSSKLPRKNFYTSTEFNIDNLLKQKSSILEVGRSCVDSNYRDGRIIRLLWKGLILYFLQNDIDYVIGCASFFEKDSKKLDLALSYLHYFHRPPKYIESRPILKKRFNWNLIKKNQLNKTEIFRKLPPLIKGYIRTGSWVCSGAIYDKVFDTFDVCIILKVSNLEEKYSRLARN